MLSFKVGGSFHRLRLFALVQTLLDTGCRIDELLTLTIANVDFDNLLMTVRGKGSRENSESAYGQT